MCLIFIFTWKNWKIFFKSMCTQLIIKYTKRSGIFPMLEVDEVVWMLKSG